MPRTDAAHAGQVFRFGSFRLSVPQRLLQDGRRPVPIGSRALDILIVLLERHGELVSKQELIARVWPATVVVEGNLTAQITALRRALHDARDGNRFIISEPGRGYRFVAPVAGGEMDGDAAAAPSRDALSLMRMMQLCDGFIEPAGAPAAPGSDRAIADAILQRGIQALEFARALVSRADAADGRLRFHPPALTPPWQEHRIRTPSRSVAIPGRDEIHG